MTVDKITIIPEVENFNSSEDDLESSPRRIVKRSPIPVSPMRGTEIHRLSKRHGSSLRQITEASVASLHESVRDLLHDELVEEIDGNSPGKDVLAPAPRPGLVLKPELEDGEELYMEVDSVDLKAHNGMRGFAALVVMILHCVYYSEAMDIFLGTTVVGQMTVFFILAGYTLTVVYGRKKWRPIRCCCCCGSRNAKEEGTAFDKKKFWVNRMARIMPMYWLTTLLMIPMAYYGHAHVATRKETRKLAISLGLSVFGGNTWFLDIFHDMNGVNWTISMLIFWYWVYPCILTRAQKKTSDELRRGIAWQLVYSVVLYIAMFMGSAKLYIWWNTTIYGDIPEIAGGFKSMLYAWWAAYSSPFTRLPCFIMGVYAGLLSLRETADYNPFWYFSFMGFCKPCGNSQCCFQKWCCLCKKPETDDDLTPEEVYNQKALSCVGHKAGGLENDHRIWAWRTDMWTGVYVATTIFCAKQWPQLDGFMDPVSIVVSATVYPMVFLAILVGLTRCGGTSWTYQIADNLIFNFYGVIGLTVYMLHWPVQQYISFFVHGDIVEKYAYCWEPYKWYTTYIDPEHLCHTRTTEETCNALFGLEKTFHVQQSPCLWYGADAGAGSGAGSGTMASGFCGYKATVCFGEEFWTVTTMPRWGIWATILISTVLSYLATLYFEIPARNLIRKCVKGNGKVRHAGVKATAAHVELSESVKRRVEL